ncbi:MAG: PEP/pyruvate-binding domain-containing protein [Syntrophobacteraceae bacterium]
MPDDSRRFFLTWDEAFEAGSEVVGGKGWNLGRLYRYGFPVPVGGVLSVEAYRLFVVANGLGEILKRTGEAIAVERIGQPDVEDVLSRLREQIMRGSIPVPVHDTLERSLERLALGDRPLAVRSSATAEDCPEASFAGIFESFLNLKSSAARGHAIKACYASLWTSKAVAYRRKMNIADERLGFGVIVMAMVSASAAGVAFSCDPRTGRGDDVTINANHGLGESVVGGLVEPDEYHLDSNPLVPRVRSRYIGRKQGLTVPLEEGGTLFQNRGTDAAADSPAGQVLPDAAIVRLALLTLRVYDSLGAGLTHQDVEWAFDGEGFWLTQARPVTALPHYTYPALRHQPEFWSNANYRDAIPMVLSAFSRNLLRNLASQILRAPLRATGYEQMQGIEYTHFFEGRAYLNTSVHQWEYFDALGIPPAEYNALSGGHQPEIDMKSGPTCDPPRWRGLFVVLRKLRFSRALSRAVQGADEEFMKVRRALVPWRLKDLGGLTGRELVGEALELGKLAMDFARIFGLLVSSAGFPLQMMVRILERQFPGRGNALANALLLGQANITSAQHGYDLVSLAELARDDPDTSAYFRTALFRPAEWETALPEGSPFKRRFRLYLAEFGHRGVYEADVSNPRWREDPSYLLHFIRDMMPVAGLEAFKTRQRERAQQARAQIRRHGSWLTRAGLAWWHKRAVRGAELREMGKSELVRFADACRTFGLEAGRRLERAGLLDQREDIFHCTWHEVASLLLGDWDGQGLNGLIAERKALVGRQKTLSPPDIIVDRSPRFVEQPPRLSGKALIGLGAAAGCASGKARLIRHPHEGTSLLHGEVLVAPSTDPAWTPLFLKASAIVMETGGALSHGAIVAREYGIPAVVNIPGVTQIIRDGMRVTVNGDEGKVYLGTTGSCRLESSAHEG